MVEGSPYTSMVYVLIFPDPLQPPECIIGGMCPNGLDAFFDKNSGCGSARVMAHLAGQLGLKCIGFNICLRCPKTSTEICKRARTESNIVIDAAAATSTGAAVPTSACMILGSMPDANVCLTHTLVVDAAVAAAPAPAAADAFDSEDSDCGSDDGESDTDTTSTTTRY